MTTSTLTAQMIESPLQDQLSLRPRALKAKKSLATALLLTSLVDAFSILVIYLIFNAANGSESLNLSKDMKLPFASHAVMLTNAPVLKVENNQYYLNDSLIALAQLPRALAAFHATSAGSNVTELIVQADEKTNFEYLNPILLSASENGFHKFKFAVIQDASAQ